MNRYLIYKKKSELECHHGEETNEDIWEVVKFADNNICRTLK